MNLNPEEKRKLIAAGSLMDGGDMAVLLAIVEFKDFLEKYEIEEGQMSGILSKVEEMKEYCENMMPDMKSDISTRVKEMDYMINELELTLKKEINSSDKNTLSQIKELSQRLGSEINRIEESIPKLPNLTYLEDQIKEVERKIPTIPPVVLDNPQQLADKLNTLHEKIRPEVIIGWGDLQNKLRNKVPDNFDVRIGVSKTELKRLTDRVIELEAGGGGGGGGFTKETPVVDVDGSNNVFTVTNEPNYIVSDGATLFDGAGYTYAALTITLDNAPTQFIRSYF